MRLAVITAVLGVSLVVVAASGSATTSTPDMCSYVSLQMARGLQPAVEGRQSGNPAPYQNHCYYGKPPKWVAAVATDITAMEKVVKQTKTPRQWLNYSVGYPSPGLAARGAKQRVTSVAGNYAILSLVEQKGYGTAAIDWTQGTYLYHLGFMTKASTPPSPARLLRDAASLSARLPR
jgi:hypothetical protein